jgi:hypothetical protein
VGSSGLVQKNRIALARYSPGGRNRAFPASPNASRDCLQDAALDLTCGRADWSGNAIWVRLPSNPAAIADREPPVPYRDHIQLDGRHQRLGPRTYPEPWQARRQTRKVLCLVCRKRRTECALGGLKNHHLPLMAFVHADAARQVHPDSYLASARQPMS